MPTPEQWDRAAGNKDDAPDGSGPFDPHWNLVLGQGIAIRRGYEGAMPVGTAPLDKSSLGVRDMAGNGHEWTRTARVNGRDEKVPLANPSDHAHATVVLRGRDYGEQTPLTFKAIKQHPASQEYRRASETIGFRVVLDLSKIIQPAGSSQDRP